MTQSPLPTQLPAPDREPPQPQPTGPVEPRDECFPAPGQHLMG